MPMNTMARTPSSESSRSVPVVSMRDQMVCLDQKKRGGSLSDALAFIDA